MNGLSTITSTLGALSTLCALSCNLLLGIDEAHVDPRLEVEESTTQASTSVQHSPSSGSLPARDRSDAGSPAASNDETDDDGSDDDGSDDETPAEADDGPTQPSPSSNPNETGAGGAAGDMHGHAGGAGLDDDILVDDDAGAEPQAEQGLCQKYCSELMELCTDGASQYRDMSQCLKVCEYLPEGELSSDGNENTVACRLRYASKARYAAGTEFEAYCRQAGPGGDGRCGSNCEGYCALMAGVCSADVSDVYHFDAEQDCMDTCEALPTSDVSYSATSFDVADGNHVQCRLFHVTSAAMLDAEEHCEHAMGFTLCEAAPTE